jgi:glycosyltransferase involved in cell wall biosynthesis
MLLLTKVTEDKKRDTRVLIISWAPVPTPKYQKIEGSGQRFFGLATGLRKNGIENVTIGVGNIYPLDVDEVSGIKLFNYDFNEFFIKKLAEYDTIIFNYTIHGSAFIAQHLPQNTQVIIDAYGPAYIENLARDPQDQVGTYVGNLAAVNEVFNKVMPRGDYFLYANDAQEKFYTGVLSALGVINQFSYHTKRLIQVPFGIDRPIKENSYSNPYFKYGVKKDDFVLLWFGGLYPWFDITKILDALKNSNNKNIKLVIVGGNNPQNQHPDFVKYYYSTIDYIKRKKLESRVILIDWVDYTTRRKYYEHADIIISLNRESHENIYSWRTRVMDYVGSTTPLITNGGDPLSEELISVGAAFRVNQNSKDNILDTVNNLFKNRALLTVASKKLQRLQPKYYWENVTKELASVINAQSRPYYTEQKFRQQNNITETSQTKQTFLRSRSIKSTIYIVIQKVRTNGVRATYKIIKDKIRRRVAYEYHKRFPNNVAAITKPRIVIVSNQLNNTGAPFVIMDVVRNIKRQHPELIKNIKFITFTPIESTNVIKLEKYGVDVEVFTNRELSLALNKNDVVVFNTFAIPQPTALSAIQAIKDNVAKKLYWYGHEHSPDGFIDPGIKNELKVLLKRDQAKVYAVSEATLREYIKFFETNKNIEKMPFPFLFPKDKFRVRLAKDFDQLHFITVGSLMDMRKGQFPILYAFLDFYNNYYKKSPKEYRNFHLEFIGAYERSDLEPNAAYHVKNIKKQFDLSALGLDSHISITEGISHEEVIKKIENANVTICYSLYEALGIFVYEGMATGHPIIRNDSAGKDEQLIDGKNGFAVSSKNFAGLVEIIEKILNKQKTSNNDLAKMSKLSNKIAKQATQNKYFIIDDINITYRTKLFLHTSTQH